MKHFGVIIGLEDEKAIVLTAGSQILGIYRNDEMYLGQDVFFSNSDIISSSSVKKIQYIAPIFAGVAAIFVILVSYFGLYNGNQPYLFVDVDINPSISFEVDETMNIKDIHSYNKDADFIDGKMNMKGAPFMETIMEYFKLTESQGYLVKNTINTKNAKQKNYVLVTTSLNPQCKRFVKDKVNAKDSFDVAISQLENSLNRKYGSKIELIVIKTDDHIRKMSVEKDMSMGRCLIYNKLKQMGESISLDEAKSGNINYIMQSVGIDKNALDGKTTNEENNLSTQSSTNTPNTANAPNAANSPNAANTPNDANTPNATNVSSNNNTSNTSKANNTANNTASNTTSTPKVLKNTAYPRPTPTKSFGQKQENNYSNVVYTPIPTNTQIRSTPTSVSKQTGRYDFENSLHGFKTMNDFKYYNDSVKVLSGLKSMRVSMLPGKDELVNTFNVDESIGKGSVITFNVWIPETDGLRAVEAFYQDADWGWTGNWVEYYNITPNSWNTIKVIVKEDVKLPLKAIGLKFAQKDQRFSCDVYIDDISWIR